MKEYNVSSSLTSRTNLRPISEIVYHAKLRTLYCQLESDVGHQFSMRYSQKKPEVKVRKSRPILEKGDHGVFRSPLQGSIDELPPHQF